jgi:hypothetical protein
LLQQEEVVVLLLVCYGRFRAEELEVVGSAIEDVIVKAGAAVLDKGVHGDVLYCQNKIINLVFRTIILAMIHDLRGINTIDDHDHS